ncbi:MAG: DNA polymerase III subunit delta, partial [Myxococcales bacterium]|nr:DNA polymerase III subunit delta [Myxococcales bacterium]
MNPEQAMQQAAAGELRPVYLVLGGETLLVERVVKALKAATDTGGLGGFNEDRFIAGEANVDSVIGAACTMPMMASRRLVVVGHLERWDAKSAGQGDHPLDRLADYAADPPPTTVMILTASKLNGSRRLVKQAKKEDFVVRCEALDRRELPGFVQRTARDKGHALEPGVADNLAELL